MKTVQYDMWISTMDTSGIAIPISKKEFKRQINHYKKEIADSHEAYRDEIEELKTRNPKYWQYSDIEHCLDDMRIRTEEHKTYIETIYSVHNDGAEVAFRERVCKPGYCFK